MKHPVLPIPALNGKGKEGGEDKEKQVKLHSLKSILLNSETMRTSSNNNKTAMC